MALTRARVIKADGGPEATSRAPQIAPIPPTVRDRILRERAEALAEAEGIVAEAGRVAETLLATARLRVDEAAATAAQEAEGRAHANLAAAWLALKAREDASASRDLERSITLAVALAERIVGASLAVDPSQIVALAGQVLAEAAGARRVRIEAHPLDAGELLAHIADFAPLPVTVLENPEVARGSLVLHTDLGTLDAKLAPRIQRLAVALAGVLRK